MAHSALLLLLFLLLLLLLLLALRAWIRLWHCAWTLLLHRYWTSPKLRERWLVRYWSKRRERKRNRLPYDGI